MQYIYTVNVFGRERNGNFKKWEGIDFSTNRVFEFLIPSNELLLYLYPLHS